MPPQFAPPSVILIEEIEAVDKNGTVGIDGGGIGSGNGTGDIERVRYEHDVYFVLVVVTVSLTVLVMVTFAIYRIVENVMEGGGGGGNRREDRNRRRGGRGGEATSSTPPRATHPSVVGSSPQGHVGRAHSVEFLSGELLMKTLPQVRCIDRATERK